MNKILFLTTNYVLQEIEIEGETVTFPVDAFIIAIFYDGYIQPSSLEGLTVLEKYAMIHQSFAWMNIGSSDFRLANSTFELPDGLNNVSSDLLQQASNDHLQHINTAVSQSNSSLTAIKSMLITGLLPSLSLVHESNLKTIECLPAILAILTSMRGDTLEIVTYTDQSQQYLSDIKTNTTP